MPFDNPANATLLRAATIVRERWRQNDRGDFGGRRCAVGAIIEALFDGRTPRMEELLPITDHVAALLLPRAKSKFGIRVIEEWNDSPGRTAEEVAALLERAAAS